jgi:hypothetical protein
MISESEELIKEIDFLKSRGTEDLEKLIDNYEIEWNKKNIEFENFCLFIEKRSYNDSIIFIEENSKHIPFKLNVNDSNFN